MLAAHPNFGSLKRDLHVGGLGARTSGAPAGVVDPMIEVAGTWLHRSKTSARDADAYVRANPWTALAVVAVVGLAAGYLLAQRSRA